MTEEEELFLRERGGWTFQAPAENTELYCLCMRFFICELSGYFHGRGVFNPEAEPENRKEVIAAMKAVMRDLSSPPNVGSDGGSTVIGRPRRTSEVLLEALQRRRRGIEGIDNYKDLHSRFDELSQAAQVRWFEGLKCRMRKKNIPGTAVKDPGPRRRFRRNKNKPKK